MRKIRVILIALVVVFCFSIGITEAQSVSDEARRHFDRGIYGDGFP